ncbi:hypothetical protein [uncultured Acinetobacter sp.]|uniref:hypothetical protein n=1 Tax=uncultured Acinetobacter sp. TaxID=165433 RepID=UPI002638732A|nr:hypothetical protein [uncultured Acinetobacter sp.]
MTFCRDSASNEITTVIKIKLTVWLNGKSNIKEQHNLDDLTHILPLKQQIALLLRINPTILVEFF